MKRNLGIAKLLAKEVPSELDGKILAYAAIRQRQMRIRRKLRVIIPAAAALFMLSAGSIFMLQPDDITTTTQQRKKAEFSYSELLAMNDFTKLEQENYAIDQLNSACESAGDTYINI